MTLLEKAKALKPAYRRTQLSDEEMDLAIAWVKGEVTNSQIITVREFSAGNDIYSFVARALREAVKMGKLKIK